MNFRLCAVMAALSAYPVLADSVLHPGAPMLDRPTLTVLGVQLPITGDDNFNAAVAVRYRVSGSTAWRQALPLFRVHPENTVLYTVAPQFAGSIFNLRPATSYDIELHAVDPDGPVDQTFTLTATTRPIPADPPNPRLVNVNSVAGLSTALGAAQPGDIIQLADGVYNVGSIFFFGSGTAQNPIVIRGTTEEGTVLDGGNCPGCNIIEVYGSFVHIERMTLRNADRAIRFFNVTQGNVVRRVHVKNTLLGIHGNNNQLDYYIADNILEGRLSWPAVYGSDNGVHAADTGITAPGFGNVVCHNQISGYGDAIQINQDGARAIDFYGNDILWSYDNGIELDSSAGNTRAFRNRLTNTWDTLSVQPILGGPAYLFRNVVVNAVDEQIKFHAINTNPSQEPNGVLAYHNTFVSPKIDLNLCTPNVSHHFWIENNLFVGPAALANPLNKAALWCGPVDDGHFDYDGYWPDGQFNFNLPAAGGYATVNYLNFAAMQAAGVLEPHGVLLTGLIFANGLIGPQDYTIQLAPQDVTLASGSGALNRGIVLPNINDGFTGAAPDLGALETGCPTPLYGPRPVGVDETNEPIGCESSVVVLTPDFSIASNQGAMTLAQGQSGNSTVTVTSLNGFNSNVGITVSGCPANAACSMNPASVTPAANGPATSQLSVTTGSTTAAGTFTLTISGTGPATVHSTTVTLTVNGLVQGGALTGSASSSSGLVNLTGEGTTDWEHWGDGSLNRKAGVPAQLSNYNVVGAGGAAAYGNDLRPVSWTDGTPTASSSNNTHGIFINGVGQGLSLTAPADTAIRTLMVHVGGWLSGGKLTAHLSDNSAPDYTDTTVTAGGQYDRNYTLTYHAVSAGQKLTVTWMMVSGGGNVTLNTAAMGGSGSGGSGSITASAGTSQSATINTALATALQATVKDSGGNPLSGVSVTFTAPSGGPSAAFNGSPTATAMTNSNGLATAPTLTANSQVGGYTVTASVPGMAATAVFSVTNTAGAPASITATAGTPQSATINTTLATALQATVKDIGGNPLSGVTVTFTSPSSGASATFGGAVTATALTNSGGQATASTLTANGQAGSYTVKASVSGMAATAGFSLTNTGGATSGALSGSATSSSGLANLTSEGGTDWEHWGDGSLSRKAGVTAQLSNYTVVGAGGVSAYSNDLRPLSWSGGTPTPSSSNNTNGIYINGAGQGFSFTAPADTTMRTLVVHAGGWLSGGKLTAHLSDGSAVDYTDTTATASGQYDRNYTLSYRAASAAQKLTVTWVMVSGGGNVTLNAAALQ